MSRFLVVGDATIDVTVARSRPPREGGDVPAMIRFGHGGQGANVAVRLARRGAAVSLLAAIGSDPSGQALAQGLAAEGVLLHAPPTDRGAAVIALLDPSGERSMLSDRQPLPIAGLTSLPPDTSWIHVSGYPLLGEREGEGDELASLLAARPPGIHLSVAGGSIPPEASAVAPLRGRLARCRPQLLVVNGDEAAALLQSAPESASTAAERLGGLAEVIVVTAGERGSAAWSGGRVIDLPAGRAPGPVRDATGSGDAYVAALIRELEPAPWPPDGEVLQRAMELASTAGAQTARVPGAQGRIPGEAATAGALG